MPDREELKPCPFCGGKARFEYISACDLYHISCMGRGCGVVTSLPGDYKKWSVKKIHDYLYGVWNRRTPAPLRPTLKDGTPIRFFLVENFQNDIPRVYRLNGEGDLSSPGYGCGPVDWLREQGATVTEVALVPINEEVKP